GDDLHGVADGVRAGSAGGAGGLVRTLGAPANADLARSEVHDGRRDEKRGNLARAAFEQLGVFALDPPYSADARTDVDTHPGSVVLGDLQARHFHRFIRGGQRQVDEAAHFFQLFLLYEVEGIKILYFGSNLAGEILGVEMSDRAYTAP